MKSLNQSINLSIYHVSGFNIPIANFCRLMFKGR